MTMTGAREDSSLSRTKPGPSRLSVKCHFHTTRLPGWWRSAAVREETVEAEISWEDVATGTEQEALLPLSDADLETSLSRAQP